MGNIVFNVAKGKAAYYASQAGTGSAALVVVPLTTQGTDAALKDLDTLDAVLSEGSTAENTDLGRKTITSVTVTVDDSGDQVTVDVADITWSSATSTDPVVALVFGYDANTSTGDDTNIIPLTKHDFAATPDGNDITATVANFYTAS